MSLISVVCDIKHAKNDDELTAAVDKLSKLHRAAKTVLTASKSGKLHDFMLLDLEEALGEIDDDTTNT